MKKKRNVLALGMITAFLLTGCRTTNNHAENEATYTTEELSTMVDDFVKKADTAVPAGTGQESMEQFFSLKQAESQIDRALDLHEGELENQYRNGTLTSEEYRTLEQELEQLEDRLDDAEDRLERTFGIND